ncbi:microprocessor complex subunit DGCR8 [Caerostris extrusa]|uniref:Microprocessor complex subunit DGCR8 n=1 Tax=Caerostris extrusa TaxID=172846 RepID=A0AAV4Q812_CAEEX|nr:microprocessor complex subunit DGCR8 [Caerostris extrusa]
MDIDDDNVGNLEITELEKIRESLKMQLLENGDESRGSSINENYKLSETEKVSHDDLHFSERNDPGIKCSGNSQSLCFTELEHKDSADKDAEFDSFHNEKLNVIKSNVKSPAEKKIKLETSNSGEKVEPFASNDIHNEAITITDEPPLVMQLPNPLLNDGLDNKHGGGGIETSNLNIKTKEKNSSIQDKNFDDIHPQSNVKVAIKPSALSEKPKVSDASTSNQVDTSQNEGQAGPVEFDILDEFESDENEGEENSDNDSDISTDEIDAMLEEGLMHTKPVSNKDEDNSDIEHEEKEKVILKVRGRNHFDVLPEGWIEVTHNSGMPIYLHKQSRVCSVSKPYFLGPGSTRKHEIPVSAIPCLHYLKELEKECEQKETVNDEASTNVNDQLALSNTSTMVSNTEEEYPPQDKGIGIQAIFKNMQDCVASTSAATDPDSTTGNPGTNNLFLAAKLETVKDTKESGSLDYLAVREYCKKRFEFQTITVRRFRTWSGRRKHQKQIKRKQRPFLPDSTKLITCPLIPSDKTTTAGNNSKREFIMNPSGKSPVCILHEYVQHTLRVQPKYVFKELESASTPYGAVVLIDNVEYGCGFGSSKKLAKSDAALEILIPKMRIFTKEKNDTEGQNVDFFDQVRVEDPRVCELSIKAGQPYPYQILLECLKRNYGMGDTEIQFMMKNLKHQKNEFYMKVGKHEISVVCKNKRDGKHRASQAILQRLHPHINSWGSLLRMYGKGSHKTMKEKERRRTKNN